MTMRAIAFVLALTLAGAGTATACQTPALDAARTLDDGKGFAVAWRFDPAQPKIGQFFAVEFGVCNRAVPATADLLRIDATMPAHRHGMNFQPKIVAAGPDLFRAEGMMFHMPGKWQLLFEQRVAGGAPARLTADVEIE